MKAKTLILMLLILALLLFLAQSTKPPLAVSDQFERARVAGEIVSTQSFPAGNNIYGVEIANTYPPLFDLQSAMGNILTGLDFGMQWAILAFVLMLCIFIFSYKLARLYLTENYALITGLFTVMLPWVFRRIAFPIAESLGLLLFLILLYALVKKNWAMAAIILPITALTHLRSTLTLLALFVAFAAYYLFRNRAKLEKLALPIISLALFAGFWFIPRQGSFSLSFFTNPWVNVPTITQMFSPLWLFAVLSAIVLLSMKRKNPFIWIFAAGLFIAAVFGGTIFGFRETAFLFFPIAFLSAFLLQLAAEKTRPIAPALIFVAIFLLLLSPNLEWIGQESYFSMQNTGAIRALGNFEGETVLADFLLSYTIPLYSDKKIVIGPFMENIPDAGERTKNSFAYYENCGALEMPWQEPDLVLISPIIRDGFGCSEKNIAMQHCSKLFDSGDLQLFGDC